LKTVPFLIELAFEQTDTYFFSKIAPSGLWQEWERGSLKNIFWFFVDIHEKSDSVLYEDVWELLGR